MSTTSNQASEQSVALMFFNDFEARTVEAIAERIIPGGESDVGATDAGVVYYIDRAIAGFSTSLQKVYRLGLRELDVHCHDKHGGAFVGLGPEAQDGVVRVFLGPETGVSAEHKPVGEDDYDFAATAGDPGQTTSRARAARADRKLLDRLFAVVREHAIEGLFCDPVYGGNRDAAGWRLVGFPGVHWGYTEEQMKEGFDGRQLPVRTLSDLRRGLDALPDNALFTKTTRV